MRIAEGITGSWSTITDVHGAPGTSGWRQLEPGRPLRGPWEAVELARLPPGGVSGLHRHTRTNEIYFVLRGDAEFNLNGTTAGMTCGHLALTTTGSTHGIRNTGQDDLFWLVIEVPAPTATHPTTTPEDANMTPRLRPIDLAAIQHIDLTGLGADPLLSAGLDHIAKGETVSLLAADCEIFGYLVNGSGTVITSNGEHPIDDGVGVTLTLGEAVRLRATEPCYFFWARSRVEGPAQ